jgi:hypothetical protein
VATVVTAHEGRGVTTLFVPSVQETYFLRVTRPQGVTKTAPLPVPMTSGATVVAHQGGVFEAGVPVEVEVFASAPQAAPATAQAMGVGEGHTCKTRAVACWLSVFVSSRLPLFSISGVWCDCGMMCLVWQCQVASCVCPCTSGSGRSQARSRAPGERAPHTMQRWEPRCRFLCRPSVAWMACCA